MLPLDSPRFVVIRKMVSPIIDKATREKIFIHTDDFKVREFCRTVSCGPAVLKPTSLCLLQESMLKVIDPDSLPLEYGGTCR